MSETQRRPQQRRRDGPAWAGGEGRATGDVLNEAAMIWGALVTLDEPGERRSSTMSMRGFPSG
jgi:hypothetical protein